MDFTNALLLIAAVIAATEMFKRLFPGTDARVTQAAALLIAIGLVFLVGATIWANTQVIGEVPLDKLGVWDKVFAGLMLGLAGNVGDRLLKSVANIGENTTDPPR